jgi:hypothetical protein
MIPHTATPENLGSVLSDLLKGRLSHAGTDAIIRVALSHARGYIRWLVWHRNYSLVPLGLSADDVAIDTIAELLSEIDGERMERLRHALEDVMRAGEPGVTLELAFKAVVLRTVRFNLARVFMEMHPVRARLLRSLRRFVQTSDRFKRFDGIAGYWYSFVAGDPRLEFPSAPLDALRAMLVAPNIQAQPAAAVLASLLEALRSFPSLRQAVCEEDVLDLTLQLLQADQLAAAPDNRDAEPSVDTESITHEALAALDNLRPWVDSSYVSRGKLSEKEAEAMLVAAHRYISDLARSEDRGHFHYLRELLPGLTHEAYRARYRNIYEYILRTIFTSVRERLQLSFEEQEDSVEKRNFRAQ